MQTKINSYQDYTSATVWEKLSFVATAKHNDKHIVNIQRKVYAETIVKNTLVFVGSY